MEDNQGLFKSAIADAKSLQKIAMSNAKKSLEEAFGPKVEAAFKSKLAEMEKKEMEEAKDEELEENTEINEMEDELEEILQELGMGADNTNFNDAEHDSDIEEASKDGEEDTHEEESEEGSESPSEEEMEEEEPVTDLTVSEFEGIVRSAVQDAMGGGAEAGMEEPEMGAPEGGDQELDLDEIMDELEETSDVYDGVDAIDENAEELEESDELEENQELEEKKQVMKKVKEAKSALEEAKAWYNSKKPKGNAVKGVPKNAGPKGFIKAKTGKTSKISEVAKTNEQLQEAIETIKSLKETLTETNLLNAKLLYVNKLFKAKQLSENQKVKVVAAFDKARTKQEAKTIYESLNETLNASTKKSLVKESLGFASKPIGATKVPQSKELIVENETVKRFQKLAGII